jgi:prolyl-tRNA synthetase
MKDLYTFDRSIPLALTTYHEVREMYSRLFDELKIPYLVAEADSGDMGGDLSHEFHFPTPKGEDHIISCHSCDYVSNEEKAIVPPIARSANPVPLQNMSIKNWYGISQDRSTLITVWYPSTTASGTADSASEVNVRAVKAAFPELDSSVEDARLMFWAQVNSSGSKKVLPEESASTQNARIIHLVDGRISRELSAWSDISDLVEFSGDLNERLESTTSKFKSISAIPPAVSTLFYDPETQNQLNLLRIQSGDACPRCDGGKVVVQKAIELGHTFHLGSRYTKPLGANVSIPHDMCRDHESDFEFVQGSNDKRNGREVRIQMGCHGIGVSRMIGAVADTLADEKGLNWPRVMAPFEAIIVPANEEHHDAAEVVYDTLSSSQAPTQAPLDLVLDDRDKYFGWKMRDADLVGYPVVVVVGKKWSTERMCEVQCRRLKVQKDIALDELRGFVNSLLDQL